MLKDYCLLHNKFNSIQAFTDEHLFLVAIATEEYGGLNAKDFQRLRKGGLTNQFLHVFNVIQNILDRNCFVLSRIHFGDKDRLIGMVSEVMIKYA